LDGGKEGTNATPDGVYDLGNGLMMVPAGQKAAGKGAARTSAGTKRTVTGLIFLGDTLLERENNFGQIEARLTIRNQGKNIIFRNLAWSADGPLGQSRASF